MKSIGQSIWISALMMTTLGCSTGTVDGGITSGRGGVGAAPRERTDNDSGNAGDDCATFQVKVLTLAAFQAEADLWLQNDHLDRVIDLPGAFSPLYCNGSGHCLTIVGEAATNAATSMMALGLNRNLDLRRTYLMMAGVAGTPPDRATLGAVAWARWVIDGDIKFEIDSREMPPSFLYPMFRQGCPTSQWCDDPAFSTGTEVYHLNETLTERAFEISSRVPLVDTDEAAAFRVLYPDGLPARRTPFVAKCDSFSASMFWHGQLLFEWARFWTGKWTNGQGDYCMSNEEDAGITTAVRRLANARIADFNRLMVMRGASDFDIQHPGETADQSLADGFPGFSAAIQNLYLAGHAVTQHIIDHWDDWKDGPPSQPIR